jgi:predicted Ser/Thr protein kinase/uncharacterized RDD family membrane protein YckC
MDEFETGTRLAHYRLEEPIGRGSMGVVYRAHDLGLDRPVALKILKAGVSEDGEFVERFVKEARAAARVSHPNLTHVYFVGEQHGHHFFAMELVTGRDLETVVRAEGPMALDRALDAMIQVARALETAHHAGVVHRDVKPSNILVQENGRVRITDFGLAKSLDADVSSTRAGQVIGTPTYMSPEQCRGREVDARTDVYSLGLTLWTLLAGRPPFDSRAIGELINDHINTPLPALEALRDDVPAGLDETLAKLCAKAVEDRPADMGAVARLLDPFRARRVQRAPLFARALAALVDLIVVGAATTLIGTLLERVAGLPDVLATVWGSLLFSGLFAGYHLISEARWQQTFGKWLLQIHVVSPEGTRPPRRTLIPRFLLRYPGSALALTGLGDLTPTTGWIVAGVQLLAILAGVVSYVASRGWSLSDRLTRTRVAIRMDATEPSGDDGARSD